MSRRHAVQSCLRSLYRRVEELLAADEAIRGNADDPAVERQRAAAYQAYLEAFEQAGLASGVRPRDFMDPQPNYEDRPSHQSPADPPRGEDPVE